MLVPFAFVKHNTTQGVIYKEIKSIFIVLETEKSKVQGSASRKYPLARSSYIGWNAEGETETEAERQTDKDRERGGQTEIETQTEKTVNPQTLL